MGWLLRRSDQTLSSPLGPDHEPKASEPGPQRSADAPLSGDDSSGESNNALKTLLRGVELESPAHPRHWHAALKWAIVTFYCLLQVFVSMTSTSYVSLEPLIQADLGGDTQVLTLGQSLFIIGNAFGPAFLGPLSDIGGRKWVYVGSILVFAILNCGSAKAFNLPMLFIFQFLCGVAGSTAISNVAGTIADLFGDGDDAGQPMALFVATSAIGPSIGSPVGQLIANNPNLSWSWMFWLNVIIGAGFALCMAVVPETLPRVVISKATRRSPTNASANDMAIAKTRVNVLAEARFITTTAFRIMFTEPIVTFLALYNGFSFGLLYLYLDGVYAVYGINYGLDALTADCCYLNLAVGSLFVIVAVPLQTYLFRRDRIRHGGHARPEARFLISLVGVWGFPLSLFWFAFTSDGTYSVWSPIVAGAVLGFADPLLYLSMLTYITDAYPHVAASAVAAFLIPSFLGAAVFAHVGIIMFANMSTTWAMATLAFISLGLVILVYVLYFFGPRLRKWSKLAREF